MFGTGFLVLQIWKATSMVELKFRLAGALFAGIGLTYLVKTVEGFVFVGM